MKYKIYVITIDRSYKRYKKVSDYMEKNNIPFTKFKGVDGNTLDQKEINKVSSKFCKDFCTKPIIGCALSHILLWKHLSTLEHYDYFIVLEDDCLFNLKKYDTLKPYIEKNINNFSLIYLDGVGINLLKKEHLYDNYNLNYYEYCYSHSCYIIKPSVALSLYNFYFKNKISYHIDYTDNQILNKSQDGIVILNPGIAKNIGNNCSTMSNKKKTLYWLSPDLYYALTFPLFKINYIVINIVTIILILLCIILFLINIKSIIVWIIIIIIFFDIITFT